MNPRRYDLIHNRLTMRQPDLTVLLDRVHKPHNFSAVLRSCDAVGVLHAHAIPPEGGLPLSTHTAQGAEKWVRVSRHPDFDAARSALKQQGFALVAADVGERAEDFRAYDWTQPSAIVLGTEKHGVSEEVRAQADAIVTIGMQGMVESLNVSVACALILFEAQRQRLAAGMYSSSRLEAAQFQCLLFEWLHPRIARYCRERKLPYPALDDDGEVCETIKGSASDPFPINQGSD